jgi:hypothetical protein
MEKLATLTDVTKAATQSHVSIVNGSAQITPNGQLITLTQSLLSKASVYTGLLRIVSGGGDKYFAQEYPDGPLGQPAVIPVILMLPGASAETYLAPGTWVWGAIG